MTLPRIFATIGMVFGAVFVFVNANGLPDSLIWPARVLGAVMTATAVWFGVIRRRPNAEFSPDRRAIRTYWVAMTAQFVAIPAGAFVLNVLGLSSLVLPWVVLVVGAHFLPAGAFRIGRWRELGVTLVFLAVVGGLGTALISPVFASACGVLAGYVLLGFVSVPRLSNTS